MAYFERGDINKERKGFFKHNWEVGSITEQLKGLNL